LEQRQQAGLQVLSRREAQLLQPLLMRLQDAIDAVSTREGLLMVFSARANNAPVLLFASDAAANITEPVMTELGLEIPQNTEVPVGADGSWSSVGSGVGARVGRSAPARHFGGLGRRPLRILRPPLDRLVLHEHADRPHCRRNRQAGHHADAPGN